MNHAPILPLLWPLLAGVLLLLLQRLMPGWLRLFSLLATAFGLVLALYALQQALQQGAQIYALGSWSPPFGIILVLDPLSALMVVVTALLALMALWYAVGRGTDREGHYFHVLFQFQLFGINGAFMTGDLFNLFVFFEVLLLASYSLLLHGQGRQRTRAGLHYVVVNLVGSTLFLFAIGTLYGMTGTLNIADMALRIAQLPSESVTVVAVAGLMLLVVFGLKAAVFPIYLWLPSAYHHTSAPVAALFAIMTKVGIYAIIRVHGTLFGAEAGELAGLHAPWLLALGLVTLVMAAFGVMSAVDIRRQIAYLVLASVALLLVAVGINTPQALSGAIYYTVHSTLIAGGLFLLADLLIQGRGSAMITKWMPPFTHLVSLGALFFLFAIAVSGLPPLSGFLGKVMILKAALLHPQAMLIITVVLITTLLMVVSLARTGSALFYETRAESETTEFHWSWLMLTPILVLLAASPLLVALAWPMTQLTDQIAASLFEGSLYLEAVLPQEVR
ncbi:monovalent cation/H+ antiporter subunit D [Ectothiorhodospiraceae bacterium BW-2]|nr:monovalent cation/H+ antiporter subunit D [Ectothiorhodospiraceae bacterium BW-2]